ncbi:RNA-directed DNA polymerase [Shewanella algae]|uniref:RNA-directed DNA polymerase n=1 Tax=Shewanella algae TaxID=38313 RepID=UPI0031F5D111
MSYTAQFEGWDNLTQIDLIVAYRKAKADCFIEDGFPSAIDFAEFEEDLLTNLDKLLEEWQEHSGPKNINSYLGHFRVVPKKLSSKPKENSKNGHTHFSDKKRAFEHFCKSNTITPEFRIVGNFPVKTHILSALWINMIGHKFDSCLNNDDVYGARLKRLKSSNKYIERPFNLTSIGSFKPYYKPYQQWRSNGLSAIRSELENKRSVVAVSLDLKSYYHTIDPSFLTSEKFQETIGLVKNKKLSEAEKNFTKTIVKLLKKWGENATKFSKNLSNTDADIPGGLVMGLTVSRIISNVLLWKWDQLIREELTPVHYGRYVDDMFLVLHDGGKINDTKSFMEFISERLKFKYNNTEKFVLKTGEKNTDIWSIDFPKYYLKDTKIKFQSTKQKLFILEGEAGFDLIDSIEQEMYKLSSEHRLMPSIDQFEKSTAVKVLIAAESSSESADTLRRADGLSLHRLSWSIQLRQVETLARDIPASGWKKERKGFYQFAYDHILCSEKILNHYTYLPRLLSLAISLKDWDDANKIVTVTFDALDELIEHLKSEDNIGVINGIENCELTANVWDELYKSMAYSFIDCAAKAYPTELQSESDNITVKKLARTFMETLLQRLSANDEFFSSYLDNGFYEIAPKLQKSDLAKTPYKLIQNIFGHLGDDDHENIIVQRELINILYDSDFLNAEHLIRFLAKTQKSRLYKRGKLGYENILPYVFPTRPYTSSEIVQLLPECIGKNAKKNSIPIRSLARYISVLRGSWVSPNLLEPVMEKTKPSSKIKIGKKNIDSVIVAVTSLSTKESSWEKTACNNPDHSLNRYKKICELINGVISSKPRPDYLVMPELSLPLKWVDSITDRLTGVGINLIAGTEYRHFKNDKLVSEACLVLKDDRLGYPHWTRIWQQKLEPAPSEEENLTKFFGKSWAPQNCSKWAKPVYVHNGFHFGVMICSELQNSKARVAFQGNIDALAVLSWNKDLETFSTLVESAALDIHAYTIFVNNRNYGDSRVRSPAKQSFLRDLARIKGGENDFFVTVELNIKKLREFQSRAKRWPKDSDPFKPVPEGFEISTSRKVLPPR